MVGESPRGRAGPAGGEDENGVSTATQVPSDQGGAPDRSGGVRAYRPTDVALALRGATTVAVWRTSQGLWLRRVEGAVMQPPPTAPWMRIGSPTRSDGQASR